MGWKEIVGANIRRLREKRGASQETLAAEAKVGMRYLGFVERGKANPSAEIVGKIAEALGVHPGRLFDKPSRSKR